MDLKVGSQVWRAMLQDKDFFDQEIWWEPRKGHTSVWFHNWTQLISHQLDSFGALFLEIVSSIAYLVSIYDENS